MRLRLLAVPALALALLAPVAPASASTEPAPSGRASGDTTDGNSWYAAERSASSWG